MEGLDNILSNGMGLLDGVQAYGILTGRKKEFLVNTKTMFQFAESNR